MEEFIEQINERIAKLQEDPTDVNIGKISELHLVKIRLHQLILNNIDDKLKVKEVVSFDDWAKKQGYKQDFFYFKKHGNYLNPMELYKKYKDEILNR